MHWPSTDYASRPTTETLQARSGSGYATTPTWCSPTPTCSITRCCPGTRAGRRSCADSDFVVIDEMHHYRGLFGAHVAAVIRRLRRIAARYGSHPTFILASATASDPEVTAEQLTGVPCVAVTDDASPRGEMVFALWEPPFTELHGERGAPVRRTAAAEVASLLTDLVVDDVRTLAFVRSRRGAEVVSLLARHALEEVDPDLPRTVAAYRAGFLPEERRLLEKRLTSGDLRGVAATSALELGIDVTGLDAVLLAGWPGTRASLWQQAGRAGRAGQGALAVLVARDDPLDTYLVHHPDAIFGQPVEATVFDPQNPYVLGPHLAAAAAELPLTTDDLALFGDGHSRAPRCARRTWLAPRQEHRLVLDQAGTRHRPRRPSRNRRNSGTGRRELHRTGARHRRPGFVAHDRPCRGGLRPPG